MILETLNCSAVAAYLTWKNEIINNVKKCLKKTAEPNRSSNARLRTVYAGTIYVKPKFIFV